MMVDENLSFLYDTKLIYLHGLEHSLHEDRLNRRFAVHHFHLAIEQVIREKLKNYSLDIQNAGFDKITKKLHHKKNIPCLSGLLDLNKARNVIQHHNIIPDKEDIKRFALTTRKFLVWSYSNYFSLEFDSLEITNLVNNVILKTDLEKLNKFIEKKEYKQFKPKAEDVYYGLHSAVLESKMPLNYPHGLFYTKDSEASKPIWGKISGDDFQMMIRDLLHNIYFSKFKKLMKSINNLVSSEVPLDQFLDGIPKKKKFDKEEALHTYNLITTLILNLQSEEPTIFDGYKSVFP